MANVIESIRAEFFRYKGLAEAAIAQLPEAELSRPGPNDSHSIAVICRHIAGNFRSRFADFLASDGEKPWRRREEEFQPRTATRAELLADWEQGWEVLLGTLAGLSDEQLDRIVTIRRQPLAVLDALQRSLAHLSYHVGQIVYIAKASRGKEWTFLSIPPGMSDAYNQSPTAEQPAAHRAALGDRKDRQ